MTMENATDIQKLIDTLLSDEKLKNSSNTSAKVYKDEPILLTATQIDSYTPPRYREMRKIAAKKGIYLDSDAGLFYEQARFMEDFEDEFDYRREFIKYYPTYQAMSDYHLRGYFAWRTKVRRGIIRKTSLSFAYVYIYELLNGIGVSSPEEGFHKLKAFWRAYREWDASIDRYVPTWLKDYVIYHTLDKALLEGIIDTGVDKTLQTLLNYDSHSAAEVFTALCSLSSYKIEKSRFYKKYPKIVSDIVYTVFTKLSKNYDTRINKRHQKFFGRVYSNAYKIFNSAVFYDRTRKNCTYEISDVYKYRCRNGSWSCEKFFCYGGRNQHIGELLKTIDYLIRKRYGFKSTLKAGKTAARYEYLIIEVIDAYLEGEKQAALPKIDIDVTKLADIRNAALEIQTKLITEEEEPELAVEDITPLATHSETLDLSDLDYDFIRCVLYGRPYHDLLKSKGLLLTVLIDTINETLFDRFADTVLIEENGKAEVIEDYREELKGLIPE